MGSVKNKKLGDSDKIYQLSKLEKAYLTGLVMNRNLAYNQYQSSIQAYLSSLGADKWGIKNPEQWEFQADLEKGSVQLSKVKDK